MLLSHPFFNNFDELKRECEKFNHPEELLAMRWCMHYRVPLSLSVPYPFHLLTYEGLVRRGEEEIIRLFARWAITPTQESFSRLIRPSKTVTANSQVVKDRDSLSGWRGHLSTEQITRIHNVVRLFHLDFYTDDLEPDQERLKRLINGQEMLHPLS